jgi:small subunit ribosomal protein S13
MIPIAGVTLPQKKHIKIALCSIFGIGVPTALKICEKVGIEPSVKVQDIAEDVARKIKDVVAEYMVEGSLREFIFKNIKRKKDIKCYQGVRHRLGLPVRGQNTRTNAKTRKGKGKGKSSSGKKK